METLINLQRFHKPLIDAGIVPAHCRLMRIDIGTDGAMAVTFEVFVTAEQLVKLGAIFTDIGNAVINERV